jgi:sugar phosphate isomerase/epimerase
MFRRQFLAGISAAGAAAFSGGAGLAAGGPWFEISLAEWSLHRDIRRHGRITNLDFPRVARREFGIGAVEYVNQFFMDKAEDAAYLRELNAVSAGEGVRNVLVMCDNEGALGAQDEAERLQAVANHHKWARAAAALGCHSIRVNVETGGAGGADEQRRRVVDSLARLGAYAADLGIGVLVENHGGLSSDGRWLAGAIGAVGLANVGTLPDFGNFVIDRERQLAYDPYRGVEELMPYARGVSAKSRDFDAAGDEATIDYMRMMGIVKRAGYRGYVGIEYAGERLGEADGIRATKRLLERVGAELA